MSSSRDNRQRAAARARLERQMAERREAAQRRRKLQARIAGGVAAAVLVGAAIWVIVAVNSGGGEEQNPPAASDWPCVYPEAYPQPTADPTASAEASPTADPSATGEPSATADPSATAEPTPTSSLPEGVEEVGRPDSEPPQSGFQVMTLDTNLGVIEIEMDYSKTPCTANSMAFLADQGFFDHAESDAAPSCHRIVESIFALQCGDPSGTGLGGPNYTVADENLPTDKIPAYHEGDVAMANTGSPDTNTSQFFFVYGTTPLDFPGDYSLWGKVISGFEVLQQVAAGGAVPGSEQLPNGPNPTVGLIFNSVTVGPITPTSAYTPTPTPSPTATATPSPSETPSPTTT